VVERSGTARCLLASEPRVPMTLAPSVQSLPGDMSNLAIQRSPHVGPSTGGMLPPHQEAHYALVRTLPLFEGVRDEDLVAAIAQNGIFVRQLERDMFVLD